jgi:hypothetical protein
MMRTFSVGLMCWAVGLLLADWCVAAEPALAVESPANKPAGKADAKKPHGRLPAHYTQVVNEKQRETIYKIQAEYAAKIEALETQLKAIKAERDERVSAVLTVEQKKKVEEAAARVRAKRAKPVESAKNLPKAPVAEKGPQKTDDK